MATVSIQTSGGCSQGEYDKLRAALLSLATVVDVNWMDTLIVTGIPAPQPKPGKLTHRPATIREAQAFVDSHHRHNKAPQGARYAIAAEYDGAVVGVVIVGRPVARHMDDGKTCEVVRCCVLPDAPRNTPSYLYGAARRVWQAWGGQTVITYTLESEPGDSLRGAGFRAVAKTQPAAKGWGRDGRDRENAAIYQIPKTRWQSDCHPQ
jgi:hypothetical protein